MRRKTRKKGGDSNLLLILILCVGIGFLFFNYRGSGFDPLPPNPSQPLDEYVISIVSTINTSRSEIEKVAKNYELIASEIDTLSNPLSTSTIKRPQDAICRLNTLNKQSLGTNYSEWEIFFLKVEQYLVEKDNNDLSKSGRSVYSIGEYFKLIASGLRLNNHPNNDLNFGNDLYTQERIIFASDITNIVENSSSEIEQKYENGEILGALLDEEGQPDWARELAREGELEFYASQDDNGRFPETFLGAGAGRRAVYWNYALRFDNDPLPVFGIKQITGNCVEASWGDVGLSHLLGVSIFLLKKPYQWEGPGSTAFYAFRGHSGQGMSLGKSASAHSSYGYAVRKNYLSGKYDLTDTVADQKFGMNNSRSPEVNLADFLNECQKTPIGKVVKINQDVNLAMDVLFVGGFIHTGSTYTANKDGNPVSTLGRVGPHAQTCIGYDDTDEFKNWYKNHTGKTLTEPVFIFDQTWGDTQYIRSNFPYELWGKPTRGMFALKWNDAKNLINSSSSYAYYPDLKGVTIDELKWRLEQPQTVGQ